MAFLADRYGDLVRVEPDGDGVSVTFVRDDGEITAMAFGAEERDQFDAAWAAAWTAQETVR